MLLPLNALVALATLWSASCAYSWLGLVSLPLLALLLLLTLTAIAMAVIEKERRSSSWLIPLIAVAICAATAWLWQFNVPLRARFSLIQHDFDDAATALMHAEQDKNYTVQEIGGVKVFASFRNEQGLWFRTFSHPDGAIGFFKSTAGAPPHAEKPGEFTTSVHLRDDWYLYRIRWD